MDGNSIRLSCRERKSALQHLRTETRPEMRLRAHILLLLDDGWAWSDIVAALDTSPSSFSRWKQRYETDDFDALFVASRGRPRQGLAVWVLLIVSWITEKSPRDFGFLRSRWSCSTVALLLEEKQGVKISAETVRRQLHQQKLVWRRPRPVLGRKDPAYPVKLGKIRHLLPELPTNETAVFSDEVDLNLNPDIGSMWMLCGRQAEVLTPGNNDKRYLAGAVHWRTGKLLLSEPGRQPNALLFVAHLNDLRRRLRGYRRIHVICDNARFHDCRLVQEFLARWGHRIELHFLPKYAPQTNPIERIWWHLREEVTRNHRCQTIEELIDFVLEWNQDKGYFEIETSKYPHALAA